MSLIVSKSISQLLLPPGSLILLALAGLLFFSRRFGRLLVLTSMLLLWLFATEPVKDALLSPLEQRHAPLQQSQLEHIADGAVIVVLGCGLNEKAPEYGGINMPSQCATMRNLYAAFLSKRTGMDIYTTGGVVHVGSSESEGVVMKRQLVALGVSEEKVFNETAALNTWQNAAGLYHLLEAKGEHRIVLVTTAWHMPRAVWVFKIQGFEVLPAPCDFSVEPGPYDLRSFLPRWDALADSANALHEYLGLAWYYLRYG